MADRSSRRLLILGVLVVSLLLTLVGRLWYLQIIVGHTFASAAANNNVRVVVTPAPRGLILDSAGRPLAANRTEMVVTVDGSALSRQPDRGAAVLHRLAAVVGQPYAELAARITPCGKGIPKPCWNGSPVQPVPVVEDAPPAMALRIAEHQEEFAGVAADFQAVRYYPHHDLAAQLLGYLTPISPGQLKQPAFAGYSDTDLVGAAGLEKEYEARLRGTDGTRTLSVDRAGRVNGVVAEKAPQRGDSLVTSLSLPLQQLAEQSLVQGIAKARTGVDQYGRPNRVTSGAVVVLDPTNGNVLAMASAPTYDPNIWTGGISRADYARLIAAQANDPLISRATDGQFSPGSTFKVVSATAAVDSGFDINGTYDCPSAITVGNRQFHNYESLSYGPISLHKALVKSCDTVFYPFAVADWQRDGGSTPPAGTTPKEIFAKTARGFGLGRPTGIDLPTEAAGRIPDRAWRKAFWEKRKADYCKGAKNPAFDALHRQADAEFCADGYLFQAGDAANFAIGQGDVLVTPLQLAKAYAGLADNGVLHEPQIGRAQVAADGHVVWHSTPKVDGHTPGSAATRAYIVGALHDVTRPGGTAYSSFADWPQSRVPMAAKTGTAEVGLAKTGKQDTSWVATFAPVDHPKYVVVTMLEQTGGHYTSDIARAIFNGIYGVGRKSVLAGGTVPSALPAKIPAAYALPLDPAAPAGLAVDGGPVAVEPDRLVLPGRPLEVRRRSAPLNRGEPRAPRPVSVRWAP